ncbi:MAG TPA: apolipoprotein N-acyltransferase [Rhodocyclaceae bacterium]|nr:apolipoprotein N-acyltransferase [Rhodocyclaceae bacterium]
MILDRLPVRLGAAALLGGVGVFAFAPFGLFWLAPLACLGFFLLLGRAANVKAAFLTGWAFGAGFFLLGVSWIYVSLSVFGGMPPWLAGFATVLFCVSLGLFPALAAAVFKRWQPAGQVRQAIFFAALLALADWVRGWAFTGFPWLALGYSQVPPSPLAGFAPIVGVHGLGLLVAAGGALLAVWRVGLPVLAVLAAAGFGLRQVAWTEPVGEPVSVALVQGNIPQEMKFRPEHFVSTLLTYRDLVARNPARLTVLPETAFPAFLEQVPQEYLAEMKALARRQGGDLVFGAATGDRQYWNSAATLGTAPMQVYSKSHLVPFGEFIPPGFAWFMAMASIPMSDFSRGPLEQAPFAVAGQRVAPNICYEDAFGEEIIRSLPAATLLVNMSNTAWFGRSLAQPQHLQISQLRALETGRPMLRATNTGMTAVVAPDGTVQAVLPPFVAGVLRTEVRGYQGLTPYARFGNWPAVSLAFLLVLVAARRVPGRRRR